jgi:hypothetical protein
MYGTRVGCLALALNSEIGLWRCGEGTRTCERDEGDLSTTTWRFSRLTGGAFACFCFNLSGRAHEDEEETTVMRLCLRRDVYQEW